MTAFSMLPSRLSIPAGGVGLFALVACGESEKSLPTCPEGALFTELPFELERMDHVVPLGQLNPPGHTIPTAHMYWNVKDPGSAPTPLRAPAKAVIRGVKRSEFSATHDDYAIRLEVCDGVEITYSHVTALSPALAAEIDDYKCDPPREIADGTVTDCHARLSLEVEAGAELGTIGDAEHVMGVDFGVVDERVNNKFVNAKRHAHLRHIASAFDYFTEERKAEVAPYLGFWDGARRTALPLGGQFAYDVAGSARGSWYRVDGTTAFDDDYAIAMVPDFIFPHLMAFSIANVGTPEDAKVLFFDPLEAGKVRRPFEEVVAGAGVHCVDALHYDRELTAPSPYAVLLEVLEGEALSFAMIEGPCGEGPYVMEPSARIEMER